MPIRSFWIFTITWIFGLSKLLPFSIPAARQVSFFSDLGWISICEKLDLAQAQALVFIGMEAILALGWVIPSGQAGNDLLCHLSDRQDPGGPQPILGFNSSSFLFQQRSRFLSGGCISEGSSGLWPTTGELVQTAFRPGCPPPNCPTGLCSGGLAWRTPGRVSSSVSSSRTFPYIPIPRWWLGWGLSGHQSGGLCVWALVSSGQASSLQPSPVESSSGWISFIF